MAVVDVEELAKKQGLKPNLQLFADKATDKTIEIVKKLQVRIRCKN